MQDNDEEILYYDNIELFGNYVAGGLQSRNEQEVSKPGKTWKSNENRPRQRETAAPKPSTITRNVAEKSAYRGASNGVDHAIPEEQPPALPPKRKDRVNKGYTSASGTGPLGGTHHKFRASSGPSRDATETDEKLARHSLNVLANRPLGDATKGSVREKKTNADRIGEVVERREIQQQAFAMAQAAMKGIHSLVDAPLAPILEEESHADASSTSLRSEPRGGSDSDSSSSSKYVLSDESTTTTERGDSTKQLLGELSSTESKSEGENIVYNSDIDETGLGEDVAPYGMVDLSALDHRSPGEARMPEVSGESDHTARSPREFNSSLHAATHAANSKDNVSERQHIRLKPSENADGKNGNSKGKHSTAVSTLDRHGVGLASPHRTRSADSEPSSRVFNKQEKTGYPSRHQERFLDDVKPAHQRPLPPKPTFSVFKSDAGRNTDVLKSSPKTSRAASDAEPQKQLQDEETVNHYHEIEIAKAGDHKGEVVTRSRGAGGGTQEEFQDILDMLKLPAAYYESKTIDVNQFPFTKSNTNELSEYDNFQSMMRINEVSKYSHEFSEIESKDGKSRNKPQLACRSLSGDISSSPSLSQASTQPTVIRKQSNNEHISAIVVFNRHLSAPHKLHENHGVGASLHSTGRQNEQLTKSQPAVSNTHSDSSSDFTLDANAAAKKTAAGLAQGKRDEKTKIQKSGGKQLQTDESLLDTTSESQDDVKPKMNVEDERHSERELSLTEDSKRGKSLANSTQSLNRNKARNRKKSPLRAKFKFRSRSKSHDRMPCDSGSEFDFDKISTDGEPSRRSGSRLSRRVSRKLSERRGRSVERKTAGAEDEVADRSRNHNPVSFIRKLLRKSRTMEEGFNYHEPDKSVVDEIWEQSYTLQTHVVTDDQRQEQKSDALHGDSQKEKLRNKVMSSPPSRRARKLLHSKPTKSSASHETAVKAISGPGEMASAADRKTARIRREEDKFWSSSSSSDVDGIHSNSHLNRTGDGFAAARLHHRHEATRQKAQVDERDGRFFGKNAPVHPRSRFSPQKASKEIGVASRARNAHTQQRQKYKTLVSLNAQTLKKVTEKWLTEWRNRLPVGGFLITSWSDITLVSKQPQCVVGDSLIYVVQISANPEHKLACQIFDQSRVNPRLLRQLENSSMLTAHPNLCNICSHFFCRVPGRLLDTSRGDKVANALCVVLANRPAMSLAEYVARLREENDPKQRHKQVLILALQMLHILHEISSSGFNLPCITRNHIIISQENALLQVLPHMECTVGHDHHCSPPTLVQNVASIIMWMVTGDGQFGINPRTMSYLHSKLTPFSKYSFSLLKIVSHLGQKGSAVSAKSAMELVQCALWGPADVNELAADVCQLEDLELWVDMQQAKLVNSLAVLLSSKSDLLPIDMFYKHQYFSQIIPQDVLENLRILERVNC